jgi:hypothetical protein
VLGTGGSEASMHTLLQQRTAHNAAASKAAFKLCVKQDREACDNHFMA